MRVQVVSAVVAPIEMQGTPKKKLSKESYLTLRLRAQQVGALRDFAADPYTGPARLDERPRPKLTGV